MLSAILAVGAVPLVITALRRAQLHSRWVAAFQGAARTLGGHLEAGDARAGPSLRAEVHDVAVAVRVRETHQAARTIVTADAVLSPDAPSARLYIGWDVRGPPAELAHIPEVRAELRRLFDRRVFVRSDWSSLAELFVEREAPELGAFLRAAPARATEVLYRGGRVHVALHGPAVEAGVLVTLVHETARLCHAMAPASAAADTSSARASDTVPTRGADTAPTPRADTPPVPRIAQRPDVACHLCAERSSAAPADPWVRCLRCDAPYHQRCWAVATGCVAEGCVETRALAL